MNNAELIKALRCCIVDFNSTQSRRCNECPYRIYADGKKDCENKAKRDAADALEAQEKALEECARQLAELSAKVPKEGEWQWLSSTYDRVPREMRYWCSVCHHEEITHNDKPWKHYCPNCGARMQTVTDCHTLNER